MEEETASRLETIIDIWTQEHPKKTWFDKFKETFPQCTYGKSGELFYTLCVRKVWGSDAVECWNHYTECWNSEAKE